MIARRLRPIGWVAGVAGAALSFYLVSLQVAAERTALESVERKIVLTQSQIRTLETEFSARASLRQLESYNNEVLALAAPKVDQYLTSEVQLAAYVPGEGLPAQAPRTALASAETVSPPAAVASAPPARPVLRPAVVPDARSDGAPVIPAIKRSPMMQAVAMIEELPQPRTIPAQVKVTKPKAEKVALLDDGSIRDIARTAAKEAKAKR
ncbi:hypothetical protein HJG53_04635 [Sphingomonas sp. ID1715]|uniref:hypothetical protein n=1 Tax=Sphingomonas sp. ID1715 TaxID=1656898 RepID=UPI001487D763|nr:hypothetical protein [Sphingomonas sp. ID1715]NNM76192.1 hypothetical protein [Sphingomonas sp. ID1715]